MANPRLLFMVTGLAEAATGLSLLCAPAVVLGLLLALHDAAPETLLVGRLAGAALLAIGLACWFARNDQRSSAQLGLSIGLLLYNVSAVVLLGWAGMALRLAGALLWPAVGFHAALAGFCAFEFRCRQTREPDAQWGAEKGRGAENGTGVEKGAL